MASSDLPYVQAQGRRERVSPVLALAIVDYDDRSGLIEEANVATPLFEAADETVVSRFVSHVGPSGVLWVNFLGGEAGANAPGSLPLKPGALLVIPSRAPVSIIGDAAGIPFTAAEG